MCAGAPDQDAKSLGRFGEAFGVAFQIIDDLADYDIPKDLAGEALNQVRLYNTRAVNSLKDLDPSPATAGLARLPNFYLTWVMEIQNVIV